MNVHEMTAGIRSGREDAFDAFYAAYADRMFRYLLVAARGNEDLAREAQQNALLRVIRYMKVVSTDEELWRYLSNCMRSAWIDLQRHVSATEHHTRAFARLNTTADAHDDEQLAADRLHILLETALDSLSADDRRLIEEHYFEGRAQNDIAAARAVPAKALSMRFVRLRRQLRDTILRGLRLD